VGLGREKEFGEKQYRDCVRAALAAVQETGARDACLYFAELHVPDRDAAGRRVSSFWPPPMSPTASIA